MTKYLSSKITFFSFWMMVLVVLLHSVISPSNDFSSPFNYFQGLLSLQLAQIAVPMFLMISGYLFFFNIDPDEVDLETFKGKVHKRVNTLLLPYVLWCTFWFLIMWVLQIIPFTSQFFTSPLWRMSLSDKIFQLFIYPLNYPFWFLRELMIYILLSPIIYFFIKKLKLIALAIILLVSFFKFSLFSSNINVVIYSSLFFFCVGAFLGIHKRIPQIQTSNLVTVIITFVWLIMNILTMYLLSVHSGNGLLIQVLGLKNLIGCVAIWQIYDLFNHEKQWHTYTFYKYSFFIFAFHGVPVMLLVGFYKSFSSSNTNMNFLCYILIFISITALSAILAHTLKKYMARTYNVLTGNRK